MRIALVTGGASGLGLATARRFAADGMKVFLADLNGDAGVKTAAELPGAGHAFVRMDVADEASVAAAFDRAEALAGPVAVVANFAGIVRLGEPYALADLPIAEWDRVLAVNATGSFLCCREMARRLPIRAVEHGRIILVSSSAAQLGGPSSPVSYQASKGAVLSLTKGAARALAQYGVTVNAIAPGPIDSPMFRAGVARVGEYKAMSSLVVGRVGMAEEVAAAAAYLASAEAAFVTGSTLDVNGGLRMQ
ncbi:MAG: SDR family oxidoreductase [Phenylobacterium sp.]|uniref:SDR family NAD(P)-dependent oxidoreductase n=1 Tax=Phenylobacterium sp. TaxID=1871053 RepID=UPI0027357BF6|nr:SDR family oxidoreductase [Phenylobacterium sp.]MDP3750003.1 SDR family oxidoreductase [Phenylobacterium sp.]